MQLKARTRNGQQLALLETGTGKDQGKAKGRQFAPQLLPCLNFSPCAHATFTKPKTFGEAKRIPLPLRRE